MKENDKKFIQKNNLKTDATMDGLLYVEYNEFIESIAKQFK